MFQPPVCLTDGRTGNYLVVVCLSVLIPAIIRTQPPIDRKGVIDRHRIIIQQFDSLASLSIGNGNFAFTVDPTGLQSFPEKYINGVPLGTQSSWGWHSFPNRQNFSMDETYRAYSFNGKSVNYSVQGHTSSRQNQAVEYFRSNPHRLQLANIGIEFYDTGFRQLPWAEIKNINQQLDLWSGVIRSQYNVLQIPVEVTTVGHPDQDLISFKIRSPLIASNGARIRIRLPSPGGAWKDTGNHWDTLPGQHFSYTMRTNGADILHQLDTSSYSIQVRWKGQARFSEKEPGYFILQPGPVTDFECSIRFSSNVNGEKLPSFKQTRKASEKKWKSFWMSGGAIDFGTSGDPRARELERRIILSQYLTRLQCASDLPPQETGLTFNSWYGRPHLEMYWWHALHFILWGRPELMEKSLDWFFKALPEAKRLAQRQGFRGARWQKMTDMNAHESPSSVGAFLVWQQPHVIYLCELLYKLFPHQRLLTKYRDLVFESAEFMSDYLAWDSLNKNYRLGPGLIPAQESHDPMTTINPTFELAYWGWALSVAQTWRIRSGLAENKDWAHKLTHLAPLPVQNGIYLAALSAPDSYNNEKYLRDHPSVLGAFAGIPSSGSVDPIIMNRTLDTILKKWNWPSTWGWDYPLIAMAATRLNRPEAAVDALLMDVQKNTYLINGHNYQDPRLTIYLPGNGGLLAAVAMMCAGTEQRPGPVFPANGSWTIKWEKIKRIF